MLGGQIIRTNPLRIVLFNARSIRNKFSELRALLTVENIDVVGITESWIHGDTRDFSGEYMIPGYKMAHKDRIGREGGGVLLYIRDSLDCVDCNVQIDHEVIGVDLKLGSITYRLLLVYRPPHRHQDDDADLYGRLGNLIDNLPSIILGDFNCHINWENREGDGEGKRLLDFASDNFLTQWVREPTRGNNVLDLVFTTEDNIVTDLSVDECLGGSDHNIIRFSVSLPLTRRRIPVTQKLDFRRANFNGLRQYISRLEPMQCEAANTLWSMFKEKFMEGQSEFIPLRQASNASVQPKWFTREIGIAIRARKQAYQKWTRSKLQRDKNAYIHLCRRVKGLVRKAKREEELRVANLCKENPKEFFGYVNSHKPIKHQIGPLEDSQGVVHVADMDMANILNDYFVSVYTRENSNDVPVLGITHEGQTLDSILCTVDEVTTRIEKLNQYKSPGPDGFLPRVLREVSRQVASHLTAVFNKSLESGVIPEDWRFANVTPIYKKGDRKSPGNYRPISLTSVVGKMLESIITDEIVDHLENHNLIVDSQHGFRQKRSCLTNLLEFFHDMMREHDKDRAVDVLYLDFQKAFDKVPHGKLMSKVRALGIGGKVADWIQNWLSGRKQRVVVNGTASRWSSVTSGVPQGSVLGPLLFIIYINDIDIGLLSKVSKFADDTKLGANVSSPEGVQQLQADLQKLGEWSEKWQMPFNLGKCKVMHIGHANPRSNYSLLGSDIEATDLEKDLGVLISSDLKFSKQCTEVEKKAQRLLGYIKRQFQFRNKEIVLTLYNSLIRPHLEYAVQFWSPTLRKDIERLERVQARATKLIPSIRHRGYERRLQELGLFSLETRRLRGQLIEVFKLLHGFENVDYRKLFKLSENPTRNNGWKLDPPRFRTTLCGNFFSYKIVNTWNDLPSHVVNSTSVDMFKSRLDIILHTLAA